MGGSEGDFNSEGEDGDVDLGEQEEGEEGEQGEGGDSRKFQRTTSPLFDLPRLLSRKVICCQDFD